MMDRKEEELLKNQALERKALPKRIRQEMKAREMMFRESMRISVTNLHEALKPTEEKDRLKKVTEFKRHTTKKYTWIFCNKKYIRAQTFNGFARVTQELR